MRMIDGDAAVWLLRKHDMYDAAELLKNMPALHAPRQSIVSQTVFDFLNSGADRREISTKGYKNPLSCYQVYREHIRRKSVMACYVYMDQKRVFLARVPGRATDGETANIRN